MTPPGSLTPLDTFKALLHDFVSRGEVTPDQRALLATYGGQCGISPTTLDLIIQQELAARKPSSSVPADEVSTFIYEPGAVGSEDELSTFTITDTTTASEGYSHRSTASYPPPETRAWSEAQFSQPGVGSGGLYTPGAQTSESRYQDWLLLSDKGAMSLLYKARRDGQWFAIKRLRPERQADRTAVELFHKEYKAHLPLQHEHIVRVYNWGEFADGPYYELEFVDGEPLTNRIPLADRKLVRRIACQLLEALGYLHKRQLYHRDLKPDNIMITFRGDNVKLIDLGLVSSETYADPQGTGFVGTRKYAAPEQLAGETIDGRTDLYAFGKILCEMLTGSAQPTPEVLGSVPPDFRSVITKCIQPDPAQRYRNAEEIISLLMQGGGNAGGGGVSEKDRKDFFDACTYGSDTKLNRLIERNLDLNITNERGESGYHVALAHNHPHLVPLLISANVDPNLQDNQGQSALHCAVASERLDLVRLMVEYGADVNLKDSKARTPLMRAAHLNRRDLIAFLLDAHADPLAVDASGHLALHYLLAHPATPDTEAAVQLLVSRQLTEIQRMPVAYDLLAWATQHQAMQLLNYLLDNQFDPNVEIAQRPSILEIAVSTKSDRLITRLLQAGAGNLKRNDLLKAAFWAIQEDRLTILAHCLKRGLEADATPAATPDAPTLLLTACQYNRKACIETLIHANARLENTLQGHVAVAWAVENGEAALLKLALQHGAPAHVLYNTAIDGWVPIKELEHKPGETALIRACRLRQATCALEFVRAGATKASAQSGDFALMYAVTDGHLSLVKELLEAGVSPKLMDTNHRMVAKIARSKGHREIYQLLRAAGAPLHSPFETQRFIAFGLWGLYLVIAAVVGFYLYDHHDYITLLGLCVVSLVVYQALSALWKKPR